MPNTQNNKSVEEIEQEVIRLTRIAHPYDQGEPTSRLEDELRKTLQAERQKREEIARTSAAMAFNIAGFPEETTGSHIEAITYAVTSPNDKE